jgi:hypothetical protein
LRIGRQYLPELHSRARLRSEKVTRFKVIFGR